MNDRETPRDDDGAVTPHDYRPMRAEWWTDGERACRTCLAIPSDPYFDLDHNDPNQPQSEQTSHAQNDGDALETEDWH